MAIRIKFSTGNLGSDLSVPEQILLSICFALVFGMLSYIPFAIALALLSLAIPSLHQDGLVWFGPALVALAIFFWINRAYWRMRKLRLPHYDVPLHEIMARLKRFRRSAPRSAFRARIWGAINLVLAFAWFFGVMFVPQLVRLAELRPVPAPNAIGIVVVALALLPLFFFIFNGARLLAGFGSFGGLTTWLLASAVPYAIMFLGPAVPAFMVILLWGQDAWGVAVVGYMLAGAAAGLWLFLLFTSKFGARANAGAMPKARDALWGDRRPPILFLRSFQDDNQVLRPFQDDNQAVPHERLESVLAKALSRFGPVIAVGEPGVLPQSGAARDYYAGEDWQTAVTAWMTEALVVVMIAGYTAGLRWELHEIIKRGLVKKLIVVFPANRTQFEDRWRRLAEQFARHPLGPDIAAADRTDAILLHVDGKGRLVTLANAAPDIADYKSALALAIYGIFTGEGGLRMPRPW